MISYRKGNMKQLILFIIFSAISILGIAIGNGNNRPFVPAQIYVVDTSVLHLIPLDCELTQNCTSIMANEMLSKLVNGFDENKKIRRVIPEKRQAASVRVDGKRAVVNLNRKYFEQLPPNKELEQLLVYQLVNSLTSIEGIDYVQFTIDGQTTAKFAGFLDMREIFVSDDLV